MSTQEILKSKEGFRLEGFAAISSIFSATVIALSVAHEWGFFQAIGLRWITILTISDFVAIGIEWIPTSIAVILSGIPLLLLWMRWYSFGGVWASRPLGYRIISAAIPTVITGIATMDTMNSVGGWIAYIALSSYVSVFAVCISSIEIAIERKQRGILFLALYAPIVLVFTAGAGFDSAQSILNSKKQGRASIQLVSDDHLEGISVLRYLNRGVLVHREDFIELRKWEDIKVVRQDTEVPLSINVACQLFSFRCKK